MSLGAPEVSVCIPVYNREHQIGDAMRSVLAQDFGDYEILVLDDGSTDGTCAQVAGFADPRIRIEANPGNLGIPASRNRCLELARGRYIAWLDSDDVMSPRRLSRQVAALGRNEELATVGGWVQTFYDCGKAGKRLVKPLVHEQLRAWLLFRCCHANTTLMGRTEIMRRHGYREEFKVSEDYDLSVRMTGEHRVANLACVLTRQRQHAGRTTAGSTDRSFDTKAALATAQLDRLGLHANAQDLAFHYALTRIKRPDLQDPAFLDWSAAWLNRLAEANRKSRMLDEAALADVLQLMWAQVCAKVAKLRGPGEALKRYRQLDAGGRLTRMMSHNLAAALRA